MKRLADAQYPMDWLADLSRQQRIGGGFLFLLIAVAVLAGQPFEDQFLLAAIAGLNLLISAGFFVTVGRETATADDTDFVGQWALSVATATFVYASISMALSGEIDILQFTAFVVGFSLFHALFSWLREQYK